MSMNREDIKLIEPTVELKSEFLAMVEDFKTESNDIIDGIGAGDFEGLVCLSKEYAKGIGLPEGWVPASTFWLICKNRIVGTCDLRHELNDSLRNFGGHIGYAVRPSQRGKGYGRQMLRLALEKARALGIKKMLVTCGDDNIASVRVIEKNGGKLADKVASEHREVLTRRYWIEL